MPSYEEDPRERILERGSDSVSDAELLALLLAESGRPAQRLARSLLQSAGDLTRVLQQGAGEWLRLPTVKRVQAARLLAAVELGRRYLSGAHAVRESVVGPDCAARYFHARLCDRPHETFGCLFLDTRHRLIAYEELFHGTVDGATVHAREVVKRALYHNAAAVIAGHNHPSGIAEPSEADRAITLKLAKALALIDIRLLDHVVVARGGHASLADRGWL
jgi:DNA repair protein RadC